MNVFKFTTFTVQFKGNDTFNEIYKFQLKELKDTLVSIQTKEELNEARLELMEMLAVTNNKLARLTYPRTCASSMPSSKEILS